MAFGACRAAFLGTTSLLVFSGGALAQEPATQLEKIVLEGRSGSTSADRILQKNTATATKTGTPVAETPQSVTTITRKQIEEQSPRTVSEALRYTTGVLSDRDSNSRYDSIFLRGFGAFGTEDRNRNACISDDAEIRDI